MSWINHPSILLTRAPQSPFDETESVSEKHDALAQLVLVAAIAIALYKKTTLPVILALSFLVLNYLLCVEMNKNNMNYMQLENGHSQTRSQQPHVSAQWMTNTQNPCQCQRNLNLLQTGDQLQSQPTWNGSAPTWGGHPSPQLSEYPNNPTLFDQPYAVRSRLPSVLRVTPDSSMARMFNSPNTRPVDQQMVPIPDPTLMARQPVCVDSPYTSSNVLRDAGKLRWIT